MIGEVIKPTPKPKEKSIKEEKKVTKRCSKADPDCGLLHDTIANLWGGMKDLVEALEDKMTTETASWKELNNGFNVQSQTNTAYKGQLTAQLSEVSAAIKEETSMQTQKDGELKELDAIYEDTKTDFEIAYKEIL